MKRDERVRNEIHVTKSIGYTILWYGMFASLLYRWFYLDQSLSETLDLFIVWLLASIVLVSVHGPKRRTHAMPDQDD